MDRNIQYNRNNEKYFNNGSMNHFNNQQNSSQFFVHRQYVPNAIPYQTPYQISEPSWNYNNQNNFSSYSQDIMGNRSYNAKGFISNTSCDRKKSVATNRRNTIYAPVINKHADKKYFPKAKLPEPMNSTELSSKTEELVTSKRSKSTSVSSTTKESITGVQKTKEKANQIPKSNESFHKSSNSKEPVIGSLKIKELVSQSPNTKETFNFSSDTKKSAPGSSKKRKLCQISPNTKDIVNESSKSKVSKISTSKENKDIKISVIQPSQSKGSIVERNKTKESDTQIHQVSKDRHFDITRNINSALCPSNTSISILPKNPNNDVVYEKVLKHMSYGNQMVDSENGFSTGKECNNGAVNNSEKIVQKSPSKEKRHNTSFDSDIVKKPRLEVTEEKINWKCIQALDDEILISKKAIKFQVNVVKKLGSEYECELQKLKDMKETKKYKVEEREKVFKVLQSVVEDSSDDDDVEIVNVTGPTKVIAVDSSSEYESSSDESCEVKPESEAVHISRVAKEVLQSGSVHSSKSTTRELNDSFSLIPPGSECGIVSPMEPTLETIQISKLEKSHIVALKVFNDRLFVASSHGVLRQYDMKTQECLLDYLGHSQVVKSILPCETGNRRLFSGGFDNKLLVHNMDTAELLDTVKTTSPILSICESLNFVYVGTSAGKIISYSKIDLKGVRKEFQVVQDGRLTCIACVKDSSQSWLFVGTKKGELSIWDADKSVKLKDISPKDHRGAPIGFVTLSMQRLLVYSKSNIHFIYYGSEKSPITVNHFTENNSLCITKNYTIIGTTSGYIFVHKMKGSVIYKTPFFKHRNADSPILSITFYNNTIISGDKRGSIYFNRLMGS